MIPAFLPLDRPWVTVKIRSGPGIMIKIKDVPIKSSNVVSSNMQQAPSEISFT
ncbi:hypothetical protein D3C72_2537860 [compost metagenome]